MQYTHTDLYLSTGKIYSAEATGMFYCTSVDTPVAFCDEFKPATIVRSFIPSIDAGTITEYVTATYFCYYFAVNKGDKLILGPKRSNRTINYYIIPFN